MDANPMFGDGIAPDASDGAVNTCPPQSTLIYLISEFDNALHSFYPPMLKVTKIGTVACNDIAGPFAMSVGRDGYAWVLFGSGKIYRVNTLDASCTPTSFVPNQHGFMQFGMGFSSDTPGGTTDTLYVCWTQGLAKIDPTTLVLTPVGTMPGLDVTYGCDLTGTGAAELFSFAIGQSGWSVAQVDKTTSAPLWQQSVTPPLTQGGAWGTSFWGGDLYLYKTGLSGGSQVWRFKPSDKSMVQVIPDLGFNVVGAGESTCAPTTPPN